MHGPWHTVLFEYELIEVLLVVASKHFLRISEAFICYGPVRQGWSSMARIMISFALLLSVHALAVSPTDPAYDHQSQVYQASFSPVTTAGPLTIAPFFAPEHAADTLTELIQSANTSVDIMTPSVSSWISACGAYVDDDAATCAPGCTPQQQQQETFPLFPALLNAMHRGCAVRLITNDYGYADCPGTISMLQYLALNGASVRFFTTTTFVHAKYIAIDNGTKAAVSSINWSKTSMTKNREAGALISGNEALLGYMQAVFEADFTQAYDLVPSDWSAEELAIITDPTDLPVVLPTIWTEVDDPALFVTPAVSESTVQVGPNSTTTVQASPVSCAQISLAPIRFVCSRIRYAREKKKRTRRGLQSSPTLRRHRKACR